MIFSLITLLFIALLCGATIFVLSFTKAKKIKRINLLKNIDQKLFMTAWLGFFFASFFLILCFLAGYYLQKEYLLNAFAYGKEHPGYFFQLAGALFATMTISVYIVRRIGIRVYTRLVLSKKSTSRKS